MLEELGFREYVALTKKCVNVESAAHGYDMLATLVRVPELDGTFLDLETVIIDDADLLAAHDRDLHRRRPHRPRQLRS